MSLDGGNISVGKVFGIYVHVPDLYMVHLFIIAPDEGARFLIQSITFLQS